MTEYERATFKYNLEAAGVNSLVAYWLAELLERIEILEKQLNEPQQ
jgi:hypothetical protein